MKVFVEEGAPELLLPQLDRELARRRMGGRETGKPAREEGAEARNSKVRPSGHLRAARAPGVYSERQTRGDGEAGATAPCSRPGRRC